VIFDVCCKELLDVCIGCDVVVSNAIIFIYLFIYWL